MSLDTLLPPVSLCGQIRAFGPMGPKYEVSKPLFEIEDGDWMMEVILIETGEKVQYRLTRLVNDPKEL